MAVILVLVSSVAMWLWPSTIRGQDSVVAEAKSPRVLVLYSQRREIPIIDQWGRGIREGIETHFGETVVIDSEYLDFDRLDSDEARQAMLKLVLAKYHGMEPDVIIPVQDGIALHVARHNPFPRAALVFCSILERTREQLPDNLNATGVLFRFDAGRTVRYARRLFPATKGVVVISGSADADALLLRTIQTELSADQEIRCEYWTGMPIATLLTRVSQLPEGQIVLFNLYLQDQEGRHAISAKDLVAQISAAASVPVFALYDTLLGTGIVGGYMPAVEDQGQRAGDITARILQGQRAAEIPFAGPTMNRFIVDWRELRRWGIGEQQLPVGAVVRFRQDTFWEVYRWYVIAGMTALVLQSLLIVALLWERRKRQAAARARARTETELRASRLEAEHLSTRIVTALEDERKRIARELHDDVSQRLAAGAIQAGRLEQQVDSTASTRDTLSSLKQNLIALSNDVHLLSRSLYPPSLRDFGLREALQGECDRAAERGQLPVNFRCGALPDNLPKRLELCLYRIVQEALSNAIKHARTPGVDVCLSADLEFVELEVQDDGIGFDPDQPSHNAGIGLQSMRDRVQLEHGEILISSVPGHGTCIQVRLPLGGHVDSSPGNVADDVC